MSALSLIIFYVITFFVGTIVFVLTIGYMDKQAEKRWLKAQNRSLTKMIHPSTKINKEERNA
jgi:hypothetical protein